MKKLTNKKGFTLVELLVVVAIIAILMLLALPRFLDSTKGAKLKTFEANFRSMISSSTQYAANNNGSYDKIEEGTTEVQKLATALKNKPNGVTYTVGDKTITATLPKNEIADADKDYKLTYTYETSEITAEVPTGIKSSLIAQP